MVYYFAYGSNLNPERMLSRNITWLDSYPATLENYELVFNKPSTLAKNVTYNMSFANVIPKQNSIVEGVIYLIDDDLIKTLDKFEGTNKKIPDYFRVKLDVLKEKNEIVPAWVYIANGLLVRDGLKPTKEYMNHLLAGKDKLSESYVTKLEQVQTID